MSTATPQGVEPPPEARDRPSAMEGGVGAEIRDVVAHLRRRRGALAGIAAVMALLGIGLAILLPRPYTATAQILVDPRGLRVFDNEVVPNGQISDTQSALVESQARVLRSDSVLAPVVAGQHLGSDPEFDGEPNNPVAAVLAALKRLLPRGPGPDRDAVALATLGQAVKVSRVPNSFVLELSVSAETAVKAARLAQAVTEAYISQASGSREASAKRVSEGLALRLDALAAEVKRAETAVDTFRRENDIVDANGRLLTEQQLADLNNQLVAARVREGELRSRVDQIAALQKTGALPDATSETISSPAITALRNRYAEITQQRDSLLTSLGPRHPALQAATSQLDGIRRLIAVEVGRIAASTRADDQRAQATVAGLSRSLQAATDLADKVKTAAIGLRELEREAGSRRAVYESFLTRSRETREQGDLPSVNIAVISPAAVPFKPAGLPGVVVVLLVAAFGTSAGALVLFGLDHLAGRVMTARQMTVLTGLPRLGEIGGGPRPGPGGPAGMPAFCDALADAMPERPPRIVLLVSTSRPVAGLRLPFGLAQAEAREGRKVLLIDTDEDRLTSPFDKALGSERRSQTPVRATPVPNLSVLAWSAPFTGAASTDGRGGAAALRHFAVDHDVILVHALAGEGIRLRPLAAVAGTVVILADSTGTTSASVQALRQELGHESGKVAGFAWVRPRGAGRVAMPGPSAEARPTPAAANPPPPAAVASAKATPVMAATAKGTASVGGRA